MKVKLLSSIPLCVAAYAARVCTSTENKTSSADFIDQEGLLRKCIAAGHHSILRHVHFVFEIQGVTRALLQQIVRHNFVDFSVKSTRWTLQKLDEQDVAEFSNNMFVRGIPYHEDLRQLIADTKNVIRSIIELRKKGVPNDILKYFLPEGVTTNIVMTVNAQELRHIFTLRTQPNVLEEFRELCLCLYQELETAAPNHCKILFQDCADWDKLKEEFS